MSVPVNTESQTLGYEDRPWIPRFWDGMTPFSWFRLLWTNHFEVSPWCWKRAVFGTALVVPNFVLWLLQLVLLGRRIARTKIVESPIFIIGHWRSGTTLLHELLTLDSRFTFPNTYDCFAPNHFLISGWFLRPALALLLPKQRPMDSMAVAWNLPQEHEFALCNMGTPSPYLTIAFPNRPPQNQGYFDLDQISSAEKARWKESLLWFLKCLTWRDGKTIVLKSPADTFRIKVLLEMFPRARFIHITRHPFAVFPSTVHLWRQLYRHEGLQLPDYRGLHDYIFQVFNRMYKRFDEDRHLLAPSQFCEVRYEDLVSDPIEQMRAVYARLGLGAFELDSAVHNYFAERPDFRTNQFVVAPEVRAQIRHYWGWFMDRYGYTQERLETARRG